MIPLIVNDFIEQCQQSSQQAYQQFKSLLALFDDPNTRSSAAIFLSKLKKKTSGQSVDSNHFQFLEQNILDKNSNRVKLHLLQFPSTFLPEAWSFTFYEGLVRYPINQYREKKIVELGCGIGWISISLAYRYPLNKIIGLDINPKAITCARLNLYLNALDEQGQEMICDQGFSLLNKVEFQQSDLLQFFLKQSNYIDKIIGCIPQVLSPEPSLMETLIEENSSDEYLQSLSNYSAKQGFVEDQFGLGLIARAVEQAIPLLKPNGKLILNLGGRPGRSVIEHLMQRRSFKVRRVWQTMVEQAADTEISELVKIEKNTGHRFEFYMEKNSSTPVSARTALAFAKSGRNIYHSVDVYEARMLFPEKVKSIFKSIIEMSHGDKEQSIKKLTSAIDLTYEHYNVAEERYSFLAFFAQFINNLNHLGYESAYGLNYFRLQIAEYFRYYVNLNIDQNCIFISPGRSEIINALLMNYQPALTLVAKPLSHLISKHFDGNNTNVLETPTQIEYLIDLMENLKPQLVITRMNEHEIRSSKTIQQLIEISQKINSLLVIDLTNNFDLSSKPEIHGVYRYLSANPLPSNLILMAALNNNRVYKNYAVNITLTNNHQIIRHLSDSAELTYSRTAILNQYYYGHLLEELLFFQRSRGGDKNTHSLLSTKQPLSSLSLSKCAQKSFSHPALVGNHLTLDINTIRMDYGENELSTPYLIKEALFESYLIKNLGNCRSELEKTLCQFLTRRFDLPKKITHHITFGNGIAPIYSALLDLCHNEGKTLHIATGSYGYFKAAADYKGVTINSLITKEKHSFKLNASDLEIDLSKNKNSWLFLNAPIVNPTGAIYSQQELSNVLDVALNNNVSVIIDSVFSGLEFQTDDSPSLKQSINQFANQSDCQLVILGGISKEYAAGGLRFGYAWSNCELIISKLDTELSQKPHDTLNYAVQKIIQAQLNNESTLTTHLQQQSIILSKRAASLRETLEVNGWQVIQPSGGLFLVAKPSKFIKESHLTEQEAGDVATQQLFKQANILINNSTWTSLPGYCRFVLSIREDHFLTALARLRDFELNDFSQEKKK